MSKSQIIWLIILFLILAIACAAYVAYRKIQRKIKNFSREIFGTDDLIEGWNQQADELAETPKSVSGMTRLMEPQIARDFPDFSWTQFKGKAENMLISALQAIAAGDISLLTGASSELQDQVSGMIADNKTAGVKEFYNNIHIHQTEIANYVKKEGKCVITIQSAVEFYHYIEQNGVVTEGSKERKTQSKYSIELVYIQDAAIADKGNAIGTTCPNCGAPITNLGSMVCEYCGSAVTPVNIRVWSLERFYEVDYRHA